MKSLSENDIYDKLKWLMFCRIIFTTLLLGSTIILQISVDISPFAPPVLILYGLIVGIFIVSFFYSIALDYFRREILFAYFQTGIDTLIITMILFVTGGFSSIFSFLYLVVITYSSIFLYRRGALLMAAFSSIQYGIIVDLEYYKILMPFNYEGSLTAADYAGSQVFYRVLITIIACFAVAFLSGLLSEQNRKTKKELYDLENHVKRVEKMAYMGEMAAGLAHEIKNPLAAIAGSIQILKEDIKPDHDQNRLMLIVLRETDRLSSLVNNFLLFARPPVGNIMPMKLDDALSETVELFEKDASCSGRIITAKKLMPDIWVEIDPEHLRQILWNLLINAVEAIENKGKIEISTFNASGNKAGISITDNGCGMSEDSIKLIFDPFHTTKPSGTGLGLSIVHRILEAYDGRLDVQSEINKGSRFTFYFNKIERPVYL